MILTQIPILRQLPILICACQLAKNEDLRKKRRIGPKLGLCNFLLFGCFTFGGLNMGVEIDAAPTRMQAQENKPTLYYSPYCPYSREVLAYLNSIQKKIPVKNVKQDSQAKEELKRMGGILEVPCLIIGDQALYGSETIIEWLNEHKDELEP